MAIFLDDTFTGTAGTAISAHTGEVGATWTANAGSLDTPVISDANALRNPTVVSARSTWYASGVPLSADYDIDLPINVFTAASLGAGITARMDTAADTFYFAIYEGFSGEWRIYKRVAGVDTQLGTGYAQTLSSSVVYALKFTLVATALTLLVDGVSRVTATDSDIVAKGRAGFYLFGQNNDTTGMHLQRITATDGVQPSTALPFITSLGGQWVR